MMRAAAIVVLLNTIFSGAAMSQDKPSINITSHNQQGGITAYKVVIGRVDLSFDERVAAELERVLPKDRPIDLSAVGSARDQMVATDYADYLRNKGYTFRSRNEIGAVSPPPDAPITIRVAPDHSTLLIAPRS
jgi:hypothetical protein